MLLILSPAKTLDLTPSRIASYSEPQLLKESKLLVKDLRTLNAKNLGELMDVSEKIAALNVERFQQFNTPFSPENAKPALLAFKGDVYQGMNVAGYSEKHFAFAQKHLRILSGLYGVLRPLDLMQPYRLEMGTKLKNVRGKDLYAFWDGRITQALNEAMDDGILINLASNEYFKAVQPKRLKGEVITPVFKQYKNGKYTTIALFAKRARGMMADFMITERITKAEDLKDFEREGYGFLPKLSTEKEWVFGRK